MQIYHNPRCSKSRQALELLQSSGANPEIVEYLKTPPDATEIHSLLKRLGIGARALLRKGETAYRELNLDNPALTDKQIIDAMVQAPILIERPIVVEGERAVIGRPPESVLALIAR